MKKAGKEGVIIVAVAVGIFVFGGLMTLITHSNNVRLAGANVQGAPGIALQGLFGGGVVQAAEDNPGMTVLSAIAAAAGGVAANKLSTKSSDSTTPSGVTVNGNNNAVYTSNGKGNLNINIDQHSGQ